MCITGWILAQLISSQSTFFSIAWLYWAQSKQSILWVVFIFWSWDANIYSSIYRYLGIQQVVFGGHRMGDWEEGMTNADDGYKYFEIWQRWKTNENENQLNNMPWMEVL